MTKRILVTLLDQATTSKANGYGVDFASAYRHLRTNIEFSSFSHEIKVISVVSANPAEGKSTVAANLAVVMAGQYKNVLLVDCDLRKPVIHKTFHASNRNGLTNLLMEQSFSQINISKYYQQILHPNITNNLYVITSGPSVPNPSEMLSSKKFVNLIEILRSSFDIVILDGPPVLPVPDSIPIGLAADGTLFVVASEQTEREAAKIALTQLKRSQVNILGTVITMLHEDKSHYNYSYYNNDRTTTENNKKKGILAKLKLKLQRSKK